MLRYECDFPVPMPSFIGPQLCPIVVCRRMALPGPIDSATSVVYWVAGRPVLKCIDKTRIASRGSNWA